MLVPSCCSQPATACSSQFHFISKLISLACLCSTRGDACHTDTCNLSTNKCELAFTGTEGCCTSNADWCAQSSCKILLQCCCSLAKLEV